MPFVADDLGAWLVSLSADAGRKKLTTWVLGTEQERALRQAATAAVQLAAEELRPEGGARAEELAMVVSHVFSEQVPDASLRGQATLLEALQAGIARQLAVLDDVSLTGTGQSSAQVLGLPAATLAKTLTGHLVWEILDRGSHGGPLEPLAAQLNHDVTHLQGQRLEDMVGQLAGMVREALARREPGQVVLAPAAPAPGVLQPPAAFWAARKSSMPGDDSPLVGRAREVGMLRDAFADPAARIVVVEGPGGIGKTRLAVEAADADAATLVAGTGVALAAGSLAAVPPGEPSIVVIDDAHRSPDLSGLAALLGDPRFAYVKIVLTVRPGLATDVLARMGQERARIITISLAGLGRGEIDQIVTGHGFTTEAFRRHIADIADGNPLLAHAACQVAASQATYRWSDTAALLNDLVDDRLRRIKSGSEEHRAVAVALALMTTVTDGGQLAALAGAVTVLPAEPDRLDILLADLAEAGIAVGPPYAVHPDAAAPVIAAAALNPQGRVKIRLTPLLRALGRAASWATADDLAPSERGPLGIGALLPDSGGSALNVNSALLAAQLSVLAQAAHLKGDHQCLGMLSRAVRELLPDEADMAGWLDVLVLAGAVAPLEPRLLGELRDALIRQWPPPPAAVGLWDEDPGQRYRLDTELLVKQAIAVGGQAARADPVRAVRWMLDCAWLSAPVLGAASRDLAEQAVRSLIKVRLYASTQTWDEVFGQRQHVFAAVAGWGRDRCAGPPAGLAAGDRDVRDPAVASGILLAALTPFLDIFVEEHAFGTPADADTFVWRHHVLPDNPRTTDGVTSAADAVSVLLGQLDLRSPAARTVLQTIVRLPRRLRAEGARGLGNQQPLPEYGIQTLNKAARRISGAVASRWNMLPLAVRYTAAEAAVRPGGRPGRTLADLAGEGDPIAVTAVADAELGRLLVVLPIDDDRTRRLGDPSGAAHIAEDHRMRAEHLAEQLTAREATDLLEQAGTQASSLFRTDGLWAFARAVGRAAPNVGEVLTRLPASAYPAASAVLSGLLETHPEQVGEWLSANITTRRVAELALSVADELPASREPSLLDVITATVTGNGSAPLTATGTPTAGPDQGAGAEDGTTAEHSAVSLALDLAAHLGQCRAPHEERLARLAVLGTSGPADALPRILAAVDQVLHTAPAQDALSGDAPRALRQTLTGVLRRALNRADGTALADVDYDTASAGLALAQAAPEETAELLLERTLAHTAPVIPSTWRDMLAQAPPAHREPLATAFQQRVEVSLATGVLTSTSEIAALHVLSLLGVDTPGWGTLIRGWAAGTADDRARAAYAISQYWHHPIWEELVPQLIDAGLDEQPAEQLRKGLLPFNDGIDAGGIQRRLHALQPFIDDTRPSLRQFAAEISRDLHALRDALHGDRLRVRQGTAGV